MNAPIPEDLQTWYSVACDKVHFATDYDAIKKLIERIAALTQERDQLQSKLALLTDPAAVHVNILRGTLPLTKAQAIHIAGLPADVERLIAELKEQK